MKVDTLIKGGTIVTKDGRFSGSIGVTDGRISHILAEGVLVDAEKVIDAGGKYVLPGAIDAHVHFEDPGNTHREDFSHGTAACAVGGVTTCILMPIHDPIILNKKALQISLDAYKGRGYVDYGVHGGLDAGSLPDTRALWCDTGVTAIKVFMCQSSPIMGFVNDATLYEGLKIIHDVDGLMIIHAENDEIIKLFEKKAHDAGRTDPLSFNESRPGFGEWEAIRRAIFFARLTGATIIFPHVSTVEGLLEIHQAKAEGLKVYAESCPQYFTFTVDDLKEKGPYLKFSPTMHDQANMERMWELIGEGYVDTIGSDHSPYETAEKVAGEKNIWASPNGIPGIEVELACFLNGVNQGKLSLERLVRMTSYNPAAIYGLPNKGRIEVGYDADLVLVDMDLDKEYTKDDIKAKNKWSPYLGRRFKGWPVLTMVRGVVVADKGKLMIPEGHSRYIQRVK
ncbi:MAG: amidohydrolase family protein [Planctomycetes bacterium]|nr:amidohydrolase family protein [Planctomycetota bacterium]